MAQSFLKYLLHSCHYTALSEISNRIVGVEITTHYFHSDVGFTNIVAWSTRQVVIDDGGRHLVGDYGLQTYIHACSNQTTENSISV